MTPPKTTLIAALGALSLASAAAVAGTPAAEPSTKSSFPDFPKALADYDGDGRLDALTLTADGTPRLLHNLGAAGFEDATDAAGLTAIGAARGVTWHDVDGDGRVDLSLFTPEGGVRVLYNSAGGLFAEGTEGSGLERAQGIAAARWTDLDGDGLSELWIANESGEQLWHNTGDGTFVELQLPGEEAAAGSALKAGPGGSFTINPVSALPVNEYCVPRILDRAGGCLEASSVPTPGRLFAFSTSTIPGLSADRLDGIDSAVFSQLGQSIEGSEITNSTITSAHIANGSITGADIFDSSITGLDIAFATITGSDLANDAVRGNNVLDGTLTGADIQDASITGSKLALGQINALHIASSGVGSSEVAPNAINSSHIGANEVGASDLALFAITNSHISGSAGISGSKVNSNFGAQDLTTDQRLGVGTALPLEDVHVVGSSTMGTVLIAPDEPVGGEDSELILSELDDGSYGMRMAYDGGSNIMSLGGVFNGVNTPHWQLTRDSGRIGIGTAPISDTRVYIDDDNIWGVRVNANSTATGDTYGVAANNSGFSGIGVYGHATASIGVGSGVHGEASAPQAFGVSCVGTMAVTGLKLFTQPHPQDAGKEVRFVCLEGNESGTYFRGSSKLVGGQAIIDVPEDFRLVTEADGMTVQVTPVGMPAALYVVSKDLDQIVVRGSGGSQSVDFDYFVNGVRRGYRDFEPMAENRFFVPKQRGVPFGTQYPDAVRQILVDNGTLNPDFTPNEATAAREGWVLRDPAPTGELEGEEAPVK